MQFAGKIVNKIYPKGPDGEPDMSARPLAAYCIVYNTDSAEQALQAVLNDMANRRLDLIVEQNLI